MTITTAAQPSTELDPARTLSYKNFRTGRIEITEAVSLDGRWLYAHQDMPGTPWIVIDQRTDAKDEWFASLSAARRWTAVPQQVTAASLLTAAAREAFDARDDTEPDGTSYSADA